MTGDRVTWTGLNLRDVTRVCRSLVLLNAKYPLSPSIWFVGRSRIRPQDNHVTLRIGQGLTKVYAGDTIVRHEDGSYTVEAADAAS